MGNGKTGVRRQNLKNFQQEGVLVEVVLVVDKTCVPFFSHRISHKSENVEKQAEINLIGHFRPPCFELK